MPTLTPLVEHLLAYRTPSGGQLCRRGMVQVTVPFFPPMELRWTITPYFGSYANIKYYQAYSPQIIPGAFTQIVTHSGSEMLAGTISDMITEEGEGRWAEITTADPVQIIMENISPVFQFFETMYFFLIVNTKEDMNAIREVIARYRGV